MYYLTGYILIAKLLFLYQITSEFIDNINQTQPTTPGTNITLIKITTINPHNYSFNCNNCTGIDYEDLQSENQRRRRRKRRKNGKSYNRGRESRRMFSEYPHKKHSTRVHLHHPIQFYTATSLEKNTINKSDLDTKHAHILETNRQPISKTSPFVTKILPPVRYLLPPFPNQYFSRNMTASNPERKKRPKYETHSNYRGSTKFKNTIHYQQNEIDVLNNEIRYTSIQEKLEKDFPSTSYKTEFKPIVVQPTTPYTSDNVTKTAEYIDFHKEINPVTPIGKNSYIKNHEHLISQEVANAGMQVITMNPISLNTSQQQYNNQIAKKQSAESITEAKNPDYQYPQSQHLNSDNEKEVYQNFNIRSNNIQSQQYNEESQNFIRAESQWQYNRPTEQSESNQLQGKQQSSYRQPVTQSYQSTQTQQQTLNNYQHTHTVPQFPHRQPVTQNYLTTQSQKFSKDHQQKQVKKPQNVENLNEPQIQNPSLPNHQLQMLAQKEQVPQNYQLSKIQQKSWPNEEGTLTQQKSASYYQFTQMPQHLQQNYQQQFNQRASSASYASMQLQNPLNNSQKTLNLKEQLIENHSTVQVQQMSLQNNKKKSTQQPTESTQFEKTHSLQNSQDIGTQYQVSQQNNQLLQAEQSIPKFQHMLAHQQSLQNNQLTQIQQPLQNYHNTLTQLSQQKHESIQTQNFQQTHEQEKTSNERQFIPEFSRAKQQTYSDDQSFLSKSLKQNYQQMQVNEMQQKQMNFQKFEMQTSGQGNEQFNKPSESQNLKSQHNQQFYSQSNEVDEDQHEKNVDEFASPILPYSQLSQPGNRLQSEIKIYNVTPEYKEVNLTEINGKQSSEKGLALAESQYFSDLPSEQDVSPFFQNGE